MAARIYLTIALAGVLLCLGCSSAKNKDFIEVNTEYVEAMDAYAADLEKADNSEKVAAAIDSFAKKMEELAPKMKALRNKYPEWQDSTKVPEELKPLAKKAESVAQRLPQTFMKAMGHIQDPKVTAAMQRLQASMMLMQ